MPVVPLWGVASGRRRASLVAEFEAAGAPGAVAAVITLRVTFAWRPALLQLPAALPVVAFLLFVAAAATATGAGLLGLVHPQLTQRLAGCGSGWRWGWGGGRGRRGRVLGWSLAHLGVAELARLLRQKINK